MSLTRKVAVLQMPCTASTEENLNRAIAQIEEASDAGAEIICLQELFSSTYPCQTEDHSRFELAESIPGPTTKRLAKVACDRQIVLIVSLFERRAPGLFHNSAVVIDSDGSIAGIYRKMHIPDDPSYYEKFYFTPGDTGFQCFPTRYGKIGVCVCWDQWFPEAARLTALAGAEVVFFPTAIGWLLEEKTAFGESQRNAWVTMLRSHAIANGIFIAAPNRVGIEGNIEFWGTSVIFDPYGNELAQGGENQEIVHTECDFELIETARTHWPFLRDRRIDAYDGLTKRFLDDA